MSRLRKSNAYSPVYCAWDRVCERVFKTGKAFDVDTIPEYQMLQGCILWYEMYYLQHPEEAIQKLKNGQAYLPEVERYFQEDVEVLDRMRKLRDKIARVVHQADLTP